MFGRGKKGDQSREDDTSFLNDPAPPAVLQLKQRIAGLPYEEQLAALKPPAPLQLMPSSDEAGGESDEQEGGDIEQGEESSNDVDAAGAPVEEWRDNLVYETLGPFAFRVGVQPLAEIAVTTEAEFINRFGTQFAADIELLDGLFFEGFLNAIRITPNMEMATIHRLGDDQEQMILRSWGALGEIRLLSLPNTQFLGGSGFTLSALVDERKHAFMRYFPESDDGTLYWGEGVYPDEPIPDEWYDEMKEIGYQEGARIGAELSIFDFLGGPNIKIGFFSEMLDSGNWPLTRPPFGAMFWGEVDFGVLRVSGSVQLPGYRRFTAWSVGIEADLTDYITAFAEVSHTGDTGWEEKAELEGKLGLRFGLGAGSPVIDHPLYPDELSLSMGWYFTTGPVGELCNYGDANLHMGWNLSDRVVLGFDVSQKFIGAWITKQQEEGGTPWFTPLQAEMVRMNMTEAGLSMLYRVSGTDDVEHYLGFRVAAGSDYEYEAGFGEMEENESQCESYVVVQPFHAIRFARFGDLRLKGPEVDVSDIENPFRSYVGAEFHSVDVPLGSGFSFAIDGRVAFRPNSPQAQAGATFRHSELPFALNVASDSELGFTAGLKLEF